MIKKLQVLFFISALFLLSLLIFLEKIILRNILAKN